MSDKKTSSIGSRIDPKLRSRLDEITRRFGPIDATMLNDALNALCDYVEANGSYRRPMKMVFDAEADEVQRLKAAEDSPGNGVRAVASTITRRLRKEEQERAGKPPAARK